MNDELHQPLGRRPYKPPSAFSLRWGWATYAGGLVLLGAGLTATVALTQRNSLAWSLGGRPYAIARIEPYAAPQPPAPSLASEAPPPKVVASPPPASTEVEVQSGVKVTRSVDSSAPMVIRIAPSSIGTPLPAAPDRRLVENSRYGLLPRIGADGARPMDVYARPFAPSPQLKADAPKIALIVGEIGLDVEATDAAIGALPEAVTFAFAPYGDTIAGDAARARTHGHETLLQAPMEPDDPDNDPGPHTLRVSGGGALEDLHWLMGRFSGYAGVMNSFGARFLASEKALSPVLSDMAGRGLFFLDDGAAPQSVARDVAARVGLPIARVDVRLDAGGTPKSLEAALAQLEAQARAKGFAIGLASAQPQTITRLARFARDAERRGFTIAPVSAALARGGAAAAALGAGK